MVSTTDPYDRILGSLDRSRFFLPSSSSAVLTSPFRDPLLVRKSGNAGNRARASGSVGRNSDH
jgi:hypothetical protein